jgi:hypothetical protein
VSAVIPATCQCGSIGRTDLRQCPEHFHLWRGDVRLTSVGRIIRDCWPKPETMPPADVLENARDRGDQVDKLLAAYVLGKLKAFPVGTRRDAMALFDKVQTWYDKQTFRKVEVQVLLGAQDHGGVLDFRFDGLPVDLKATFQIEQTARMQVAGYADLCGESDGYVLHVTERFKEARLHLVGAEDIHDWRILRDCWRMVARRTA